MPRAPRAGKGRIEYFRRRARECRVLITDFDGVHTDDRVLVNSSGAESVFINRKDGEAYICLRKVGWSFLILSGSNNNGVLARAGQLGVEAHIDVSKKESAAADWLLVQKLSWDSVIYVGNDRSDVTSLRLARVGVVPSDASRVARNAADLVLPVRGGAGVISQLVDFLAYPDPS